MVEYRVCARCVMDSTACNISFDASGNCNFCEEFIHKAFKTIWIDPNERSKELSVILKQIKDAGKGKKYDCIVGVSGGVDSSWVLVKAVDLGLRPLAVHMDNGWNSELAQHNIANLITGLGVDLYTHVIEWEEYRGLMQSFFEADVVDIELLYDNALQGVNFKAAKKFGVRFVLGGTNQATEGIKMPEGWNWFKFDGRNIKQINKMFKGPKIQTFPVVGTKDYLINNFIRRVKWVSFPDYFEYRKAEVTKLLIDRFEYRPYPYKHYESIFTRFYQAYILPRKFDIDKRKIHLSTLIITDQITREKALQILEEIPYPSSSDLENDKRYFLKKMSWSNQDLNNYLSRPPKSHLNYPSEKKMWDRLIHFFKRIKKLIASKS